MEDQIDLKPENINLIAQSKAWAAFFLLKKVLLAGLIVILSIAIIHNHSASLLGHAVSLGIRVIYGAELHIEGISINRASSSLEIKGFTVFNPPGFPKGRLIELPRIRAVYDLPALSKGMLHFRQVDIELKELAVIKNARGKFNVDSLRFVKKAALAQTNGKQKTPAQIDVLNLYVGDLVSKDYTQGSDPYVCVHNIHRKDTFRNVKDIQQLKSIILAAPIREAGIKGAIVCGVAALGGVWAVPVAFTIVMVGRDSAQEDINIQSRRIFASSVALLERMGTIIKADSTQGIIIAGIRGARVAVKVKESSRPYSCVITVSARKIFLPKPEIAAGILYQINEELK